MEAADDLRTLPRERTMPHRRHEGEIRDLGWHDRGSAVMDPLA